MQGLRIGSTVAAIGLGLLLATSSLASATSEKQSCPVLKLEQFLSAKSSTPAKQPKNKSKAGGFFPKHGLGEGTCTISCSGGGGTVTPAIDVQDCACACADYCGGFCIAQDLDTGELAGC